MNTLSIGQQRRKQTTRMMVSIGLECQLQNLYREIIGGDASKLCEFQQMVQYAPPEMKVKLLEKSNDGRS